MTKWISYRAFRTADEGVYHTDPDCRHVRENHYAVEEGNDRLAQMDECDECAGRSISTPNPQQECPYCGSVVGQLPMHLPCEETP